MGNAEQDQPTRDERCSPEYAPRPAGGHSVRHQPLGQPAGENDNERTEYPGHDRDEPGLLLREAQALDDERREPGQTERQRPVRTERRHNAADEGARCQQARVGNAGIGRGRHGLHQRSFPAEKEPGNNPHQTDDTERSEGVMPAMVDDDPVQRRHGEHHAEC